MHEMEREGESEDDLEETTAVKGGLVGDREADFIEHAVNLDTDEPLWSRLQGEGRTVMRNHFSEDVVGDRLEMFLEDLVKNKERRRDRDVMGRMLWETSFRATQYM